MTPFTLAPAALVLEPVDVAFGSEGISLQGYAAQVRPRNFKTDVNVWLRWTTTATPGTDYQVFVHVVGSDGIPVAQFDGPPMGGLLPTSRWIPNTNVDDRRHLSLALDMPPGVYQLNVGLYKWTTGERLPLADGSGDFLSLAQIDVRSPTDIEITP